mgnify:CR=1 FL=1
MLQRNGHPLDLHRRRGHHVLKPAVFEVRAQLDACSPEQIAEMLDLVARSELEVVPHPRSAQPSWQEVRSRCEGVWQALTTWFTGQEPTSRQVLDVTNKVISDVVQNAALLVQLENIGVSNKAGLHHLLTLFASCRSLPQLSVTDIVQDLLFQRLFFRQELLPLTGLFLAFIRKTLALHARAAGSAASPVRTGR